MMESAAQRPGISTGSSRTPPLNPSTTNAALPSLATASLKATSPSTSLKNFPAGSYQAPILTGSGALADEERMKASASVQQQRPVFSGNPAHASFTGLMRSTSQDVSKPSDAPPTPMTSEAPSHAMSSAMPIVAEPMEIDEPRSSPQNGNEPMPREERPQNDTNMGDTLRPPETDSRPVERSNKALTYPPRPTVDEAPSDGARGMSLPGSNSNRSSSTKKHKCPNCATEFTRHHNLKSHLLTHSQEKPFACDHCNQKFRRLHDLKRHAKLHTGERPHVCEKCKREFARGDALARHAKGPTGCAGRRGRGGEDDDYAEGDASFNGEDSVNGDHPEAEEQDADEQGDFKRRKSEPNHNRKRSYQSTVDPTLQPPRNPSTYPPIAPMVRSDAGSETNQFATPNLLSPRTGGTPGQPPSHFANSGSYFAAQGGVTESPAPLSPGAHDTRRLSAQGFAPPPRGRSPSLNTAFQQQHIRGSLNHVSTPPILPAPIPSQGSQQLPPLANIAPDSRRQPTYPSPTGSSFPPMSRAPPPSSLSSQRGPASIISNGPPSTSTISSSASHPRSSGGSMREILNSDPPPPPAPASSDPDWYREHVRIMDLEKQALRDELDATRSRMSEYESMMDQMRAELDSLRAVRQQHVQQELPRPQVQQQQ